MMSHEASIALAGLRETATLLDALKLHREALRLRYLARVLEAEIEATPPEPKSQPKSQPNRAAGGAARAKSLTPERRSEIAKRAAATRWKKS